MANIIHKTIIPAIIGMWTRKIKGIENIPQEDIAFIAAVNHASYMDHFLAGCAILKATGKVGHFLAKKEHFEGSLERAWHRSLEAIPIDRQAGGKEALKHAIKALKKKQIIVIYPEGTRTLNGRMSRAKTGVARLALLAKVPVVPIGLRNTFNILPKGNKIPKLKRAEIHIGKPMYFEKYYKKENDKKILRKITTGIMKEIARLAGQRYTFK